MEITKIQAGHYKVSHNNREFEIIAFANPNVGFAGLTEWRAFEDNIKRGYSETKKGILEYIEKNY